MNRKSDFFFTMQFYQTCRIPDETKKILGPKINPPNFPALISSPNRGFFVARSRGPKTRSGGGRQSPERDIRCIAKIFIE